MKQLMTSDGYVESVVEKMRNIIDYLIESNKINEQTKVYSAYFESFSFLESTYFSAYKTWHKNSQGCESSLSQFSQITVVKFSHI